MDSKNCTMCSIEKHVKDVCNKYTESKSCNCERGLKRYYDNKEKIPNQPKIYYEKEDRLLQKQNDRYIHFKEIVRFYGELQNRLKAMEEYFSLRDSENNQKVYRRKLLQTTRKVLPPKQN